MPGMLRHLQTAHERERLARPRVPDRHPRTFSDRADDPRIGRLLEHDQIRGRLADDVGDQRLAATAAAPDVVGQQLDDHALTIPRETPGVTVFRATAEFPARQQGLEDGSAMSSGAIERAESERELLEPARMASPASTPGCRCRACGRSSPILLGRMAAGTWCKCRACGRVWHCEKCPTHDIPRYDNSTRDAPASAQHSS